MAPPGAQHPEAPPRQAAAADVEDDVMEGLTRRDSVDNDDDGDEDEDSGAAIGQFVDETEDLEGATADLDLDVDVEEEGDMEEDDEDDEDDDDDDLGGAPVSPSAIPMIGGTESMSTASGPSMSLDEAADTKHSLDPSRPTPYVHDAGHLLVTDPNPLPMAASEQRLSEAVLAATARDAAQSLINHLLTSCPITSSKTASSGSGVVMSLPAPKLALPREKAVPAAKAPTKWEQFAAKKGIGKNKRRSGDGENRAGKMVYDEERGEWVPRYGYKGKNKAGEKEWLVEVDGRAERKQAEEGKAGRDPRTASRAERMERMKRNERKMRANERKAGKGR